MAEKFLIASGKGGVGKSTFAAFLGMTAAREGKKTLIVDADAGLGALDILFNVSDRVMNTWLDVFCENCNMNDAVICLDDNLFLLPSPRIFPDDLEKNALADIVKNCEKDYAYIIVDASAGIDENLERCALACDRCIFVATADEVSVRCASAAAQRTACYGIDRDDMRIVINRFVKKAALKSRLLNIDGVIDKSGVMLLGILPEDKKIPFFSVTGVMPDKKSSFMKAVLRIYRRMEGVSVPLILKKLK